MKIYLIDGNNAMHKSAECKAKINTDYAIACNSFINSIKTYSYRYPSYQFIIFFDGYSDGVFANHPKIKLEWSYSKTADDLIKSRIKLDYEKRNYALVSSDTNLHNFAKIHSLEIFSSEDFLKTLYTSKSIVLSSSKSSSKSEKPNSAGRKEINEMMRLFNEAD